MALLEGVFNTVPRTGWPTELNKKSLAAELMRLFPNGASPISGLSAMMGTATAVASTHGYFSKTVEFVKCTTSGYLVGDTTITVSSTVGMGPGSVLQNARTFENIRVLTVASATTITVTRAFGRIAAAAGNNADVMMLVGTANVENSARPTARQFPVVYVPNYTQIFRNAWALTGTAAASLAEIGYNNIAESRKDAALMHTIDQEAAVLWGQAKMDVSGSQPIHATQGVVDAVKQYTSNANYFNAAAVGATTNLTQLISYVEKAFAYSTDISNPKMRYAFGDAKAINVMNQIAIKNGVVQLTPETTSFGMDYQSFKCYKGTLRLLEHSLLNGFDPAAGRLIILDIPSIKLAYMTGRNAKVEEYGSGGKVVENGTDGQGGSFTSEMAVEARNPYGCVIIEGLTAGAAG